MRKISSKRVQGLIVGVARWAAVLGVLIGNVASVRAQVAVPPVVSNEPAEVEEAADRSASVPDEGLWPSPKLLRTMLTRWVEEAAEQYELDADQRKELRGRLVERWETFLTENRSEIQPLVNEFIEMRLELEPPDKERVEEWAQRAYPIFEKSRDQIHQSHQEFRKVLLPGQWAEFELDALKMNAGMGAAEQKLKQWREGQFEKDEFWEPLPADRRGRREERRKRRAEREQAEQTAAAEAEKDQIAVEMGRWEKYVLDFNERYRLDEGQRTTTSSCLSELKERALSHRDRHRADIADLERQIEEFNGSAETLADLKQRLTKLYGPVDEMFRELQSRLDRIPTTEQRAAEIAESKPESPAIPEEKK